MRRLFIGLSIILSIFRYASADQQTVGGQWRGLNNGDAFIQIADNEAQDLLNVDVTDNGYGIKKRAGFSQFKTLGSSTHSVRGGYYWRDASGRDVITHANDRAVYNSVAGGAYAAFLTTNTADSYYDFTDLNGFLYGADSNRDVVFRYNGTSLQRLTSAPQADQVEATPDRLAVSGSTTTPNCVDFSKTADFANFTTGLLEVDGFEECIGLTGQAINAIKWADDRLLMFTRTSISAWSGSNQYDGVTQEISNTVGSLQPSSIVRDLGVTYFQAQDGHFYAYDNNSLTWLSRAISDSVSDFGSSGLVRNWEQTSQSDFAAGTSAPTLSTASSPGSITFSTGTLIDDFNDGNFTVNPTWTQMASTNVVGFGSGANLELDCCSSGAADNSALYTALPASTGSVKFQFLSGAVNNSRAVIKISSAIPGTALEENTGNYTLRIILSGSNNISVWRGLTGISTVTYAITNDVWYTFEFSRQADGSIAVAVNDSIILTVTDTNFTNFKYLTVGVAEQFGDTFVFDNFYHYHTSGLYQSQSFNIGSAITGWGQFLIDQTVSGSALTYAIYSDTNSSISVGSASTFIASQTITASAIPTIATGSYVAWTANFSRSISTQTPALNSVAVNWYEGTTSRTWGFVDKNHRIGWSVLDGTGSLTNHTYIYDPRFNTWLKYSVPFDAAVNVDGTVYFGDTDEGKVYTWPSGTSDNGSGFNAYWKSKDFVGADPFSEKDFLNMSLVAKTQTGSNLDLAYTVNTSTTVSYNLSLSDANSNTLRRYNANLAAGKFGTFFSFRFGNDDADAPFEVYAIKFEYKPRPWRVLP